MDELPPQPYFFRVEGHAGYIPFTLRISYKDSTFLYRDGIGTTQSAETAANLKPMFENAK